MIDESLVERMIGIGRTDLALRLKHLPGEHNQERHGWRFARGGDGAAKLRAARRSMRGRNARERAEYRKRAGMPEAKPQRSAMSGNHSRTPLSTNKYHGAESDDRPRGKFESELVKIHGDGAAIRKPSPLEDYGYGNLGKNEETAFAVDRALGLDIVPETVYRSGEDASFQAFVENAETGFNAPMTPSYQENSHLKDFGKMAMLDAIVGNSDRHAGNYLVVWDRIVAIDHGLIMKSDFLARAYVLGTSYTAEDRIGREAYKSRRDRAGRGYLPLSKTYKTRLEEALQNGGLKTALSKTGALDKGEAVARALERAQELVDNWDEWFWEP